MFHTILVPLDGSARAEQAIPMAVRIARATGGTLTLLNVVSFRTEYSTYLAHTPIYTMETELACAKNYLDRVIQQHNMVDIQVCKEVVPGIAAQTILAIVERRHVDLLVLCSHGYTGIKRWALGSVAQKIARLSPVPVLMLRDYDQTVLKPQMSPTHPTRAMVALDGSPFAETVIAPAASLVAALTPPHTQGRLHLVHVLRSSPLQETLTYQQYGLDVDLQEEARSQMRTYLQMVADTTMHRLGHGLNIHITWSIRESPDIAGELLKAVAPDEGDTSNSTSDFMALATHGREGFQRWMIGSVTERVLEDAKLPLLIVRPQGPSPYEAEPAKQDAKSS